MTSKSPSYLIERYHFYILRQNNTFQTIELYTTFLLTFREKNWFSLIFFVDDEKILFSEP